MSSLNNTINLLGSMATKEANAAAIVSPGQLVTLDASGEVILQTALLQPRLCVVLENDMIGKTIDDAYAVDERTYFKVPVRGDELNLSVAASAPAIVAGDPISSAGDGTVIKNTSLTTHSIIGFAQESVDNSGGATAVFISVEIA